jgi:O-antigen/teichoic acid export membrane protein
MAAEAGAQDPAAGPAVPRPSWAVTVRRLWGQAVRSLGWGVADQAVSSLTNFAVSIYVVRTLGATQFGAFSLAYVTYGFALNASRGLSTDPLMVRFSGTDVAAWRRAVAGCTGTAALVGLASGAVVLAAAALLSGTVGAAFLALGLTLPGLMLQDSWRYSFFALGRGGHAFLNDTIWALTLLPALVVLRVAGHASVFWFVLAWGAAAAVAAAVGPVQARVLPRLAGARDWMSQHRDLGFRYLLEGTSSSASIQLRSYGVSFLLSLAALGYVQAVTTLMGPITILFLGMSLVLLPEAARILRRAPQRLPLFAVLVSVGLTAAAFAWGVVLLLAVPRGLGGWLLGPIWHRSYPLVLPQMLFVMGQAAGGGAGTGLHALGAARRSLRTAAVSAALYVVLALAGAAWDGAFGTVAGAAAAAWLGSGMCWWQFRAALRETGPASAGHRPGPHPKPEKQHVSRPPG